MTKGFGMGLLLVFIIGAAAALGKVLFWGESVTNYGTLIPWGLWVSLYIFLVATAAGAAWTGVYSAWKMGGTPTRVTNISFVVAGTSLLFGLAFIGLDLGKPFKGISLLFNASFSSKLAWAAWLYIAFFASLAGYFFTSSKKACMVLAGLCALGFTVAEGAFFGGMGARVAWNSWTTPVSFIASAAASGSAMTYLISQLVNKEVLQEEGFSVKQIMLYAIPAQFLIEMLHGASGVGVGALFASIPFWIFVIAGVIASLYLLRDKFDSLILPSLVLLGFASLKYSFIRSGFTSEPLAGISSAFQHARLALAYSPSALEWVVAVGFLAGVVWVSMAAIAKLSPKTFES